MLVQHPYDAFDTSVELFIEQAARDPQVLAIKQTLYRTSGKDSAIVRSLVRAAEAGKQVVALVELTARFDEEANITWARVLEQAGVHVVYGVVGLKTHAKLSLVVRDEGDDISRYCHVGTGNYHPGTARLYEDLGLLTADPELDRRRRRPVQLPHGLLEAGVVPDVLVAPLSLRPGILAMIQRAGASRRQAHRSKMNSLVDARDDRRALRGVPGGMRHRADHPRDLLPEARASPGCPRDPRPLDRRSLPGALAHLPVR